MTTSSFAAGAYAAAQGFNKPLAPLQKAKGQAGLGAEMPDFPALVREAVTGVAEAGAKADLQAGAAAAGRADLVQVVTAVAESEAAIETLVAVRDRVIAAYEEIMRMQV